MRIHAINSASDRLSCAQDLLHAAAELLAHGPGPHDTRSFDDVVHGDVAVVLDVLHLLTVTVGLLQCLDDQGSRGGADGDLKIFQ